MRRCTNAPLPLKIGWEFVLKLFGMNSILLPIATITFLIGLTAETNAEETATKQTLCPLMVEDEIDPDVFVEYKGVKVYMCCGTCEKQWKQNPDYFAVVSAPQAPALKAVASKKIKPLKQKFCPVYTDRRVHPKGPSLEYEGQTVYFSKKRALDRFKADPQRYLKGLQESYKEKPAKEQV